MAVDPEAVSYERLAKVVKAGFGQRRKMLRRSLAGVVEPDVFARAGIRPEARRGGAQRRGLGQTGPVTRILAPAKLTVSLEVTGKRPNGLHELRAEMVTLNLADELGIDEARRGFHVTAATDTGVEWIGDPAENLVTRALDVVGRTALVHLTKRIPIGGGLGGGSSDAAAILRWAGCSDPAVVLGLGSDVPFCVVGGRALVEGVGEVVTPLEYERRDFVLLLPPFGVATALVYAAYDTPNHKGHSSGASARRNDLTDAALAVEPRLARWRDVLGDLTGRDPVLAGSGSTWFVEGRLESQRGSAMHWVGSGDESAQLLSVHSVPAGWNGD